MRRFVFRIVCLTVGISFLLSQFIPLTPATRAKVAGLAGPQNSANGRGPVDPAGIQRLKDNTGGAARVKVEGATGAARFVNMAPGSRGSLMRSDRAASARENAEAFLKEYGSIFGVTDPAAELRLKDVKDDLQGGEHLTYQQFYKGVRVFAAELKTHFDRDKNLRVVNGNTVPGIDVNPNPSFGPGQAASAAIAAVTRGGESATNLSAASTNLYVYRTGLARGVPGEDHLVWEVQVTNGADVREFVYVDAHSNKVVDQITGTHDDMYRRAYDGLNQPQPPASYPASPYWEEGQSFPTGSVEANNMITSSKETYDLFSKAFGRDSFDSQGKKMDSIFNRGYDCPNASWNGTFISFCSGLTSDDVTAHEWGHAYTEYTHNLIYQWQPGALNESYSDIWGETVDRINNRDVNGNSGGDSSRTLGSCSTFSKPVARMIINSPDTIDGTYPAQGAIFGPTLDATGVTGNVVRALDLANQQGPTATDACTTLSNASAVSGNIALVDRGTCDFSVKVKNAQNAGAVGVVVANNVSSGLPGMGGSGATITIPSIGITKAEGDAIRTNLAAAPVNVTMKATAGTDASTKWLMGEDITGASPGALRDMWNPVCYSNPGRVTDTAYYVCGPGDAANDYGGVHTNSGVPNHAYALLVDGGDYNGQTVTAIGLTKAAHIYFRAMTLYQVATSDFEDHADALEQSADDLLGVDVPDLLTGLTSGQQVVTDNDLIQVQNAMRAVEMRTAPAQCGFQPLLAQDPPTSQCAEAGSSKGNIFSADFESDPFVNGWTTTPEPLNLPNTRNWVLATQAPDGGTGAALFAENPNTSCADGAPDATGVVHLDSPVIDITGGTADLRLSFNHYVATEAGWDGGNLKVSVDGGAWQTVAAADYTYNPYNMTLLTTREGNTNPLAGQAAFSGTDDGSFSGTWARSDVNLANYVTASSSTIRLRWDFGTDGCSGAIGWYIDNVDVYSCSVVLPSVSVGDASVSEGNKGRPSAVFTVTLSKPASGTVTINYGTEDGTATAGSDYLATSGTLTIRRGATSATVKVSVIGDKLAEDNETFKLILSSPSANVSISKGTGVGTITNDD